MRHGFVRSVLSVFLLICFTPSLLFCGQVDVTRALVELHQPPAPRSDQQYVPIVPPGTIADFLSQATETTKVLGDLPIDQVMARDLINKLLGAFLLEFQDEIASLLKSFGIELPPNWATIPLNFILDLIKFKSYNQDLANTLLTQWAGDTTPEQQESLRRFWMSQTVVKTGFDSALAMSEDATEGIYDLIDLVYGATHVLKKIGEKFENLPGVGAVIRKIRLMVSQRIIFALNNGVDLITSKMKEPARSRVRGIATALTTTYIKWAGIQVGDGFGGISPELLTKIGAKILGKFLLLLPPKIGYVSMTKSPAQYGAERALAQAYQGEFSQAAVAVLDDGNDQAENAILESMTKTVLRKQKLSNDERRIANVAGAISQIAQLIHFIDPTSFGRIVAIGAGILAGGLQLHTVFNSAITLYRIPGQVDQGVRLAFDPQSAPPSGGSTSVTGLDPSDMFQASGEYTAFLTSRIEATQTGFAEAIAKLEASVGQSAPAPIDAALAGIEAASRGVRQDVKLLSNFVVPADGGPDQMKSLLGEGLMDHDLRTAGVYADVLGYVFRPAASQRPALIEKVRTLGRATADFLSSVRQIAATGQMTKGAFVTLVAPTAALASDKMEIDVTVVSAGSEAAASVQARLMLPTGYTLVSGPTIASASSLAPGQELNVRWQVKKPASAFKRSMLIVNVLSENAPEANQSVLVTE